MLRRPEGGVVRDLADSAAVNAHLAGSRRCKRRSSTSNARLISRRRIWLNICWSIFDNLGSGSDSHVAQGRSGALREAGRRTAGDRRRAQHVQGRQRRSSGRAGSRAAAREAAAAIAGRHGGGADHRQVVVDGRQEDGPGTGRFHRCRAEPATHRPGGRAHLRQLLPMGSTGAQGRRPVADRAPDLRDHSGWRNADCARVK